MSKTREIACKYYINEKNCAKGREGTFHKQCQTCNLYVPLPGGKPARTDNRKRKNERRNKKELAHWKKMYQFTFFKIFSIINIENEERNKEMKILVLVDVQKDFIDGALGTDEAKKIIPYILLTLQNWHGDAIIATADTHDTEASYLRSSEGQKLPVPHCIRGTEGWQFEEHIKAYFDEIYERNEGNANPYYTRIISIFKNTFGVFDWHGYIDPLCRYDNGMNPYESFESLDISIMGLCTDICVIMNAMLLKHLYPRANIKVYAQGCAGTNPEKHEAALKVMESCQIEVIR